jgi:hypothetical protein
MYHVNMLFRSSIKFFLVENQNHHYTIPVNSENEYEAFYVIFFSDFFLHCFIS